MIYGTPVNVGQKTTYMSSTQALAYNGLAAKGTYANFQGAGTILCKKLFASREAAKEYEPTFLNKCCDGSLGALDIISTQVYITEHELVG